MPRPRIQKKTWVGFDLGGTKMMAAVVGADGTVLGRCRKKTRANEGAPAGLARIRATIQSALDTAGFKAALLGAIGIGCPGPLDLKAGVIHEAPNLGWTNVAIRRYLEDAFRCPVVVANDVDAGVYGEYCFGAARGARCAVGIFPGTGIGGGCVYEGRIFHGTHATCMEIGHIPLVPLGPLDGCGNAGTLESVASRLAIAGSAAQAAFRGQAPYLWAHGGTSIDAIRSGELASAIRNGDVAVERIVRHAAEHLGVAVVTLVLLLAPDVVVLGGGLVEAMPDILLPSIEAAARRRLLPTYQNLLKVKVAELGDDATALGAAAWARANSK